MSVRRKHSKMKYTYEVYRNDRRVEITTTFAKAADEFHQDPNNSMISIYDNLAEQYRMPLNTNDDVESWSISLERANWKNPNHTKWNPLAEEDGFHVKSTSATTNPTSTLTLDELKLGYTNCVDRIDSTDHINPTHYKSLMSVPDSKLDLQWLEHLQYHAHFRNPIAFKAAVEIQVRKYLDRCGGKDKEEQDLMKAIWYLKFLAAYVKNGNKPIYVKDIDSILEKK
jgi:hypothetical protein